QHRMIVDGEDADGTVGAHDSSHPRGAGEPMGPRSSPEAWISRRGRYRQFDLGSRARAAPEVQVGADPLRALPHPLQAPVAGAATLSENFRVDAASVIAYPQAELTMIVRDLHLDVSAARVGDGVDERFPPDGVGLRANQRVELPRPSFDD